MCKFFDRLEKDLSLHMTGEEGDVSLQLFFGQQT